MHWPSPHVASMGLDGDWPLGIPWNGSMGNAVGFHGLALGAAHWEFHSKCSMGMPLGCPNGAPMALHWYCSIGAPWKMPYEKYIGDSPCGLYGIGWGIDHWECHGMAFWVMHWVSMDLHWGAAHWEFHGNALWVSHWDAHMRVPWHCIGNAP